MLYSLPDSSDSPQLDLADSMESGSLCYDTASFEELATKEDSDCGMVEGKDFYFFYPATCYCRILGDIEYWLENDSDLDADFTPQFPSTPPPTLPNFEETLCALMKRQSFGDLLHLLVCFKHCTPCQQGHLHGY